MDAFPNIILLPYGRQSQPLHIRAPSWSHLLRLLAQSSTTRLESTSRKYSKLRTVVQFTKVREIVSHLMIPLYAPQSKGQRRGVILWLSIDQPVPPSILGAAKYDSLNPNILPWSYTQSPTPEFLRHPADQQGLNRYTIPATYKLPYPTLPITFLDLALYLQAALDESNQYIHDDTGGKRLGMLVQVYNSHQAHLLSFDGFWL